MIYSGRAYVVVRQRIGVIARWYRDFVLEYRYAKPEGMV